MKCFKMYATVLAIAMMFTTAVAFGGETVDAVKARGFVRVGVSGTLFGFGMPDKQGVWRGLDVDTGRSPQRFSGMPTK